MAMRSAVGAHASATPIRSPGVGVEERAPGAVDLVHAVLVEERQHLVPSSLTWSLRADVGQAVRLDQAVGDVDPEAVDAQVEPEAQDRAELVARPRGGPS